MQTKRALVTGASSGIGQEFAVQLAHLGYSVTAVARRETRLQELVQLLPGTGHSYLCVDLSNDQELKILCDSVSTGNFRVLINNAGGSVLQAFHESELSVQQTMLRVNVSAVVDLAHAFLKNAAAGDALINLASVVSFLPTPAQPMYSASKAFIASFSECLWEEQRHRGVYVMALCPGVTKTEFIATATGGESDGDTLPAALIQTSEQVVGEALTALKQRKKAIIVTGRANRLMMLMPRVLTRHRLLKVLAVIGDPDNAL